MIRARRRGRMDGLMGYPYCPSLFWQGGHIGQMSCPGCLEPQTRQTGSKCWPSKPVICQPAVASKHRRSNRIVRLYWINPQINQQRREDADLFSSQLT